MHLEGPKQTEILAVIGLMDLYGPRFYPGHLSTADERHQWAKEHFEKQVGLDRFRMFFAVHEFEAWLSSQPDIFPRDIQNLMRGKFGPAREDQFRSTTSQAVEPDLLTSDEEEL